MSRFYKVMEMDEAQGWEYVACPLCQGDQAHQVLEAPDTFNHIPGLFTLVQCEHCGFKYTNPRPSVESIGNFYPDDTSYYIPSGSTAKEIPRKLMNRLERYLGYGEEGLKSSKRMAFNSKAEGLYRRAYPRFVPNGRLLEIGCSHGDYLAQMRKLGWQVEGVELNRRAAEYAQQQMGLTVWCSSVEELELPQAHYDCVVMRMSLEHVHSPLDVLSKLGHVLKPGGEIIITVPNYDCFEAKLFGSAAYFLQLPTHLSHFTPETITMALETISFEVERICFVVNKNDVTKSAEIMRGMGKSSILLKLISKKWFVKVFVKSWMKFMRFRRKSPRMTIYAQKPY